MHSPLAISNIVVSRSVGGSSSSDALDSSSTLSPSSKFASVDSANAANGVNGLGPNAGAVPLLLRVRRVRVLLVATIGCVLVAGSMFLLSRGIKLRSVRVADAATLDAAFRDASELNVWTGAAAALLIRPMLSLVASTAPAALLCFLTAAAMQDDLEAGAFRVWTRRIAAFLLYNGLVWLLASGFCAVNTHARLEPGSSVDLTATTSAETVDSSASVDTMLRSVLRPSVDTGFLKATGDCTLPSPQPIPAQISFAFPASAWAEGVLPTAVTLTSDNSVTIDLNSSTTEVQTLPMDSTTAADLASYALRAVDDFFRPQTVELNTSLLQINTDKLSDLKSIASAVRASLSSAAATTSYLSNVSASEASLQFVDLSLSSDVKFVGATLELPMLQSFLSRTLEIDDNLTTTSIEYGDNSTTDEVVFEINPREECGPAACIISARGASPTSASIDWGSQVRVLPICIDSDGADDSSATLDESKSCDQRATNAVLVLSFASRIEGDAMETDGNKLVLSNARKLVQVTVGRLSWLEDEFSFSLSESAWSSIDVSAEELPSTSDLADYSSSMQLWTPLVIASAHEVDMGGVLKGELIFPHNFDDTSSFSEPAANSCERERGAFLARVEAARLYSEHSLQPAYTSGALWLLQNGEAVTGASGSSSSSSSTAFAGGSSSPAVVHTELAVPDAAAALTYTGCAGLWLLAVAVFLLSRRRETDIERRFRPAHLARALLNDTAGSGDADPFGGGGPFSRKVLQLTLLHVGGRFLANSELLDEFELGGVALRHRSRPADVLVVPATQSAVASYSDAAQV